MIFNYIYDEHVAETWNTIFGFKISCAFCGCLAQTFFGQNPNFFYRNFSILPTATPGVPIFGPNGLAPGGTPRRPFRRGGGCKGGMRGGRWSSTAGSLQQEKPPFQFGWVVSLRGGSFVFYIKGGCQIHACNMFYQVLQDRTNLINKIFCQPCSWNFWGNPRNGFQLDFPDLIVQVKWVDRLILFGSTFGRIVCVCAATHCCCCHFWNECCGKFVAPSGKKSPGYHPSD